MKTLVAALVITYLCWYTIGYARIVWKEGNKLAGLFISILAVIIAIIPLFLL